MRVTKQRSTEEIDTVTLHGRKVTAVAEAKWTNKPLGAAVFFDRLTFKLPALTQAGYDVTGAEGCGAAVAGGGARLGVSNDAARNRSHEEVLGGSTRHLPSTPRRRYSRL